MKQPRKNVRSAHNFVKAAVKNKQTVSGQAALPILCQCQAWFTSIDRATGHTGTCI